MSSECSVSSVLKSGQSVFADRHQRATCNGFKPYASSQCCLASSSCRICSQVKGCCAHTPVPAMRQADAHQPSSMPLGYLLNDCCLSVQTNADREQLTLECSTSGKHTESIDCMVSWVDFRLRCLCVVFQERKTSVQHTCLTVAQDSAMQAEQEIA